MADRTHEHTWALLYRDADGTGLCRCECGGVCIDLPDRDLIATLAPEGDQWLITLDQPSRQAHTTPIWSATDAP